jgi:hypothetical protein
MSATTPPAPQKPSVLAAFQTAPTLVKVLASILYGVGLLTLIQMAMVVVDWRLIGPNDYVAAVASNLLGLVVALLLLLLGRGITRGAYGAWLAPPDLHCPVDCPESPVDPDHCHGELDPDSVDGRCRLGCPGVATHACRPPALSEAVTLALRASRLRLPGRETGPRDDARRPPQSRPQQTSASNGADSTFLMHR